MEHLNTNDSSKKTPRFDYDEFSFKSVNQGLGFHQKAENPLRQQSVKTDKSDRVQFSHPAIQIKSMKLPDVVLQEEIKSAPVLQKKSPNLIDVLFAYVTDVSLITGTFLFSIGMMFLLASFIVDVQSLSLILNPSFLMVAAGLYAGIYLIYFTILDVSGTPGKNIWKFRLVKNSNEQVSLKETFVRAFVCLLSSLAFFVPVFLDFQSKLSDSKNIEN
jgi:uncharacterized RDD family membrane protein YckC